MPAVLKQGGKTKPAVCFDTFWTQPRNHDAEADPGLTVPGYAADVGRDILSADGCDQYWPSRAIRPVSVFTYAEPRINGARYSLRFMPGVARLLPQRYE